MERLDVMIRCATGLCTHTHTHTHAGRPMLHPNAMMRQGAEHIRALPKRKKEETIRWWCACAFV